MDRPRFDVVMYREGESAASFMARIENAAGLQGSTDGVVIANAGRGAVNHSPEDNRLDRIRAMEGYDQRRFYYTGQELDDLFDGEAGYFVDSRDDEARDGQEDKS